MRDLIAELERMRRSVGSDDGPADVVELRRVYAATAEDVSDACTNPERIPPLVLPVSGDLRLGGSVPARAATRLGRSRTASRRAGSPSRAEFGGDAGIVTAGDRARRRRRRAALRHAVSDNDRWATYGPGAVGGAGRALLHSR